MTAQAALDAAPSASRVPALDLARLMAAMAVVLYHYGFHGGVDGKYLDVYLPALGAATQYGYLGVNVFFVISGFVIAWSAEGAKVGHFAWSRWLRVYPTFIFSVLLTATVAALAGNPRFSVTLPQVLAHVVVDARRLGFEFVDGAYWTIVCELQFYAMVAVGLAVPWLRRHATGCLALWLAMSAINEFILRRSSLTHLLTSNFAGLFIVGMLLYRWHRRQIGCAGVVLGIAALVFALILELRMANERFLDSHTTWSPAIVAGLMLAAIALLSVALRWRFSSATERLLRRVGALTYPLYLLHATIGFIAIDRLAPLIGPTAALALTIAGMVLLSNAVATWGEPRLKAIAVLMAEPLHRVIPFRAGARNARRMS